MTEFNARWTLYIVLIYAKSFPLKSSQGSWLKSNMQDNMLFLYLIGSWIERLIVVMYLILVYRRVQRMHKWFSLLPCIKPHIPSISKTRACTHTFLYICKSIEIIPCIIVIKTIEIIPCIHCNACNLKFGFADKNRVCFQNWTIVPENLRRAWI